MKVDQSEIRKSIASGAILSTPYLIMNALATVVAGYGLLGNSTAVVIGAMIIAMLIGPIMGLALAMVDGDTVLLRKALIAEAVGAVMVVSIGFLLGRAHGQLPITDEILARTKPNLLDLMIALAGGAAGAYATVSPRISVGLVGVAIATALVPPLTSCGICLSRGHIDLALGAFILFATNLVAIQSASSIVLFAHGYHLITRRSADDRSYIKRMAIDAVLLLGLAIFLTFQLNNTIQGRAYEESVKSKIEAGLKNIAGAYLVETRYRELDKVDVIVALVRAPNSVTPDQTGIIEASLPRRNGRPIELHIRTMLTKETTSKGYMHELEPEANPVDDFLFPADPIQPKIEPSNNQPSEINSPADNNQPTDVNTPTESKNNQSGGNS